ncbi:MAG: hypothetical protein ABFD64_04540 [Armatimonadota bacterium]
MNGLELEEGRIGIRERLGSNSRLWLVAFLVIVCAGVVFITRSSSAPKAGKVEKLVENPIGHYQDLMHRGFEKRILKIARGRGEEVEARFLSDKTFKLVVPCDISSNEVDYLSRAAATGIWRRFRVSPLVYTYTENVNGSNPKLVSRTAWSEDIGDFVVKYNRSSVSP